MTNEEIVAQLEKEFKAHLLEREPEISEHYFALALDSFQKGISKGMGVIHNRVSDVKVILFDDGTTGAE